MTDSPEDAAYRAKVRAELQSAEDQRKAAVRQDLIRKQEELRIQTQREGGPAVALVKKGLKALFG